MAFDKTEPQNTTKLRNLGIVIRPNWEAIEEGLESFSPWAMNFADRTALGIANDPTAIADTVITYSKQDASGDPQLYAIDPASVITQLTGGSYVAGVNAGTLGGTLYTITLAAGVTIYCGYTNNVTSGTVIFPAPGYTTLLTALATASTTAKTVAITAATTAQMTIGTAGTGALNKEKYWLAIGVL